MESNGLGTDVMNNLFLNVIFILNLRYLISIRRLFATLWGIATDMDYAAHTFFTITQMSSSMKCIDCCFVDVLHFGFPHIMLFALISEH